VSGCQVYVSGCQVYEWCTLHDGHKGHHQRLQHLAGRLPADHQWLPDSAPWEHDEIELLNVTTAAVRRLQERGR
jgi:hypothetical protein